MLTDRWLVEMAQQVAVIDALCAAIAQADDGFQRIFAKVAVNHEPRQEMHGVLQALNVALLARWLDIWKDSRNGFNEATDAWKREYAADGDSTLN